MALRSSRSLLQRLSSRALAFPALRQHSHSYVKSFSAIARPVLRPCLAMGPRHKQLSATAIFPEERTYESDLVVVLDMDECLIHSQFLSSQSAAYAHQTKDGWTKDTDKQVETFQVRLPDGDLVQVNQRPHLHDFLDQVTDKFETHVFTAAMEIYAKPVLDTLDPSRTKFAKRWYRDSCVQTKEGAFVKNLGVLQKNEARLVLVDNNPLSFLANPSNGILVKSFYNDAADKTLLSVMQLLDELDSQQDVRPMLDLRFGLKSALDEASENGEMSWSYLDILAEKHFLCMRSLESTLDESDQEWTASEFSDLSSGWELPFYAYDLHNLVLYFALLPLWMPSIWFYITA